ncbi:unnamed protein product [Staurois parvus]|uniref:Uncharacterized protein n=1 Tax=Staurois parvus TaxID=386267 RepID=A0ABN9DD97_9NEOB|nr:unnamed protein product [Staurois parvus]
MHSPKKKKLSSNTHKTEHVQHAPKALFYQQMDWRRRGGSEKTGSNILFTQCGGLYSQ